MNIKKLLKGNFFRTFVWSFAKFFITFATSNKKNNTIKRVKNPGGRLHLPKCADSYTVGAKRQTKNQLKTL